MGHDHVDQCNMLNIHLYMHTYSLQPGWFSLYSLFSLKISIPLNLSSSFYILEQLNFFLYDLIIHIKNKSADAAFCGCHIWLDTSSFFFITIHHNFTGMYHEYFRIVWFDSSKIIQLTVKTHLWSRTHSLKQQVVKEIVRTCMMLTASRFDSNYNWHHLIINYLKSTK